MRTRPKRYAKQDSFRPERPDSCPPRDLAHNEKMIADMLRATKTRGNPRDYVLISGARLIDHTGAYDLIARDGTVGVNGVALVHKRRLHKLVGEELAALFWRRRFGIRAATVAPKLWIAKHGSLPLVEPGIAVRPVKEMEDGQADVIPAPVPAQPRLDGRGGTENF